MFLPSQSTGGNFLVDGRIFSVLRFFSLNHVYVWYLLSVNKHHGRLGKLTNQRNITTVLEGECGGNLVRAQ